MESRKVKVLPSKSFSPRSSSSDFGASVSDAVFCSEPPDAVVSLPPFEDVSPQDTLRSSIMSANDSDKVLFIFLFFLFLSVKYSPGKNRVLFIITYSKEIFLYIFLLLMKLNVTEGKTRNNVFFLRKH